MIFPRSSGILLHPTSLPGSFGIGDLGNEAFKFIDSLAAAGQRRWQILPLGPTGISNSPYNSASVFAGNPLLINPDYLVSMDLISNEELKNTPPFPDNRVDYSAVYKFKKRILRKAYENFFAKRPSDIKNEFDVFCNHKSTWLDTYSLFIALKERYDFAAWQEWPEAIKHRKPGTLERARKELQHSIEYIKFEQFLFFRQWTALKQHCHKRDVSIIGDMPIFIDTDSDSVWHNPELFNLDTAGYPVAVAGVPPDYFSSTGQLWGNPLYRWDVLESTEYSWWENRIIASLSMVDIIRLDHFRGFESYWEIPAGSDSAIKGKWMPGPGEKLFRILEASMGPLPFIAEDLGMITDGVRKLRDKLGFPGMRVIQFAFSDDSKTNEHRPYNYIPHCVVYTGTHDNDTTVGWFRGTAAVTTLTDKQRQEEKIRTLKYTGTNGHEINWDFVRLALSSVADTAIIPLQDVLGLDSSARMNTPATTSGNWEWRFSHMALADKAWNKLRDMTRIYGR